MSHCVQRQFTLVACVGVSVVVTCVQWWFTHVARILYKWVHPPHPTQIIGLSTGGVRPKLHIILTNDPPPKNTICNVPIIQGTIRGGCDSRHVYIVGNSVFESNGFLLNNVGIVDLLNLVMLGDFERLSRQAAHQD